MGYKLVLDGIGLAGPCVGSKWKAAAEHIHTAEKLFHVHMKKTKYGFGREHQKQISRILLYPLGIHLNLNVSINTLSISVKLSSMTNWFEEMRAQNDTPSKWFEVITSNQIIDGCSYHRQCHR